MPGHRSRTRRQSLHAPRAQPTIRNEPNLRPREEAESKRGTRNPNRAGRRRARRRPPGRAREGVRGEERRRREVGPSASAAGRGARASPSRPAPAVLSWRPAERKRDLNRALRMTNREEQKREAVGTVVWRSPHVRDVSGGLVCWAGAHSLRSRWSGGGRGRGRRVVNG